MEELDFEGAMTVSNETRKVLIENQRILWRNTLVNASITYKVGLALADENIQKTAKAEAAKCIRALEVLNTMFLAFEKPEGFGPAATAAVIT